MVGVVGGSVVGVVGGSAGVVGGSVLGVFGGSVVGVVGGSVVGVVGGSVVGVVGGSVVGFVGGSVDGVVGGAVGSALHLSVLQQLKSQGPSALLLLLLKILHMTASCEQNADSKQTLTLSCASVTVLTVSKVAHEKPTSHCSSSSSLAQFSSQTKQFSRGGLGVGPVTNKIAL